MKQIGCYEIKWSSQTGCVFLHYRWMTGEWKIFGRKAKIVSFTVYAIHMSNWVSGSRGEERSSTCQRAHRGKGRVQSTSWRKKKYPRRSSLFSAFFFFFSTEHEGAFPFTSSIPIWDLGFFFLSLSLSQHSSFEPIASTSHRPPANRTASSGHSILHFMQFPPRSRKLAPSHLFFYPLSTRHLLRGWAWLFKAAVRSSQVSVEPKSV